MTLEEKIALATAIFTAITVGVSFISIWQSRKALSASQKSNELSANIARRQGVIELFTAWQGVSDINTIDEDRMIGPDILRAYNAMDLTAVLWNHDVIQKEILLHQYWMAFRDIYDNLYKSELLIPGKKKTCRSLIKKEHTKAYNEMNSLELDGVSQTFI